MVVRVGLAWGCVPQPLVSVQPRASGPPGSEATVVALAVDGAAEIRWNSVDGLKLGTARGPQFSVPVIIPDVADGVYTLIVVERKPDGGLGSSGSAAFQVVRSGSSSPTTTAASATTTPTATGGEPAPASASDGVPVALAGAAGLIVGSAGGVALSRRRRPSGSKRSED